MITSVASRSGPEGNLLESAARSVPPILEARVGRFSRNDEFAKRRAAWVGGGVRSSALPRAVLASDARRAKGSAKALEEVSANGSDERRDRREGAANILILSRPRRERAKFAPIPALLAVGGVHHHLMREGSARRVGLVVETGEAREVHHFALLIGYGAGAVNPYLAFETLDDMIRDGRVAGPRSHDAHVQELHQGGRTRACSR